MLKRLTNHSEHRVYEQVMQACEEFGVEVYRKIRVADVIDITQCDSYAQGNYALMAHFDFVVCDEDHMPQFAIEFDGGGHSTINDTKKDNICRQAELAIFRIDFLNLGRNIEKMTFLRYLVHVWFMSHEFERQRQSGVIPIDEPFMMWGFLKPNARDIFDSEYNFLRSAQIGIARLQKQYRFSNHSYPTSALGHLSLRHEDGRYASFACIEAKKEYVFGSHQMRVNVPCFGSLENVPFGPTAIADFNDGCAFRELISSLELYVQGAGHTLTREPDIHDFIDVLKQDGFSMLHGGGPSGNPLAYFWI